MSSERHRNMHSGVVANNHSWLVHARPMCFVKELCPYDRTRYGSQGLKRTVRRSASWCVRCELVQSMYMYGDPGERLQSLVPFVITQLLNWNCPLTRHHSIRSMDNSLSKTMVFIDLQVTHSPSCIEHCINILHLHCTSTALHDHIR